MNGEKISSQRATVSLAGLIAFIKTLRPINLLILGLTQYFFYTLIFLRLGDYASLSINNYLLYLCILLTIIICAAGYLINDYFDFESDLINKKKNRLDSKLVYLTSYYIFIFSGLILAIFIAIRLDRPELTLYYIGASILLFMYSSYFKSKVLIGNIIVAFFSASAMIILCVLETKALTTINKDNEIYQYVIGHIIFFSVFAFLINLIRELIKDKEDVIGDQYHGVNTLPSMISNNLLKSVLILLSLVLSSNIIGFLYYDNGIFLSINIALATGLLIVPQIILIWYIINLNNNAACRKASLIAKINMFLGIVFLIINQF